MILIIKKRCVFKISNKIFLVEFYPTKQKIDLRAKILTISEMRK